MADKGSPLTPETVSYFRLIAQSLEGISDDEEKQVLITNVYSEMEGKEYRLCVNKNCSQILETILTLSSPFHLRKFLYAVSELISELSFDRNGSHVLQAIFKRLPTLLLKEKEENTIDATDGEDDGGLPSLTRIFINLCGKLRESGWLDLIYDTFGSHIVRDIICISGGWLTLPTKSDKTNEKNDEENKTVVHKRGHIKKDEPKFEFDHLQPLSHIIPSILSEISRQTSQDLTQMQLNISASPLLQLLLETLSKRPQTAQDLQNFISRLLLWQQEPDGSFSNGGESLAHVKALLTSQVGSHVLEKIIECASHIQILHLYQTHFRSNFYDYCLDPRANFCIQHLLQRIITHPELTEILSYLLPHFKELFEKNRAGVVRWLVDACVRLKTGYSDVIKSLHACVEITNPKFDRSFLSRFLYFSAAKKNNSEQSTISVMNCVVLESLMSFPFETMGRVIDSCLACSSYDLVAFACDPSASRVIDSYMSSPSFNDHVKHKLIDKYGGNFVTLALNKYGSFVLEKLFLQANKSRRIAIAQELGPAEERLGRAQTGRMLLTKFKIPLFKRAQHVWEEQMRANQKTSALFAEITDDIAVQLPVAKETVSKSSPKLTPQSSPTDEATSKKRKSDLETFASANKAAKITDQKKRLKQLAEGVVGGLPGAAPHGSQRNAQQQTRSSVKKPKKRKEASGTSAPHPPVTPQPGGLSRKEKRAARRNEHIQQKKAMPSESSSGNVVVTAPPVVSKLNTVKKKKASKASADASK